MRCPSTRQPSRASSGVISDVTKTIGTLCSSQSDVISAATSVPVGFGHDQIEKNEIGVETPCRF